MVDDPAARNAVLSVGSIQPARIDLRYTLRMVEDKVRLRDDYYVMLSRRWQIKSLKLGTAMKGNQIGNLRRQVKRSFFSPPSSRYKARKRGHPHQKTPVQRFDKMQ